MARILLAEDDESMRRFLSKALENAGHEVVVVDNLSNSTEESLRRVAEITGKQPVFYKADVCDKAALARIFTAHKIDAVIHFAGLKAVGESVAKPLARILHPTA